MIEKDIIVTTKYGRMPSFTACPEGPGRVPGIIFYMDMPGIREELCGMARRIARHGYFCLPAGHVLPARQPALRCAAPRSFTRLVITGLVPVIHVFLFVDGRHKAGDDG